MKVLAYYSEHKREAVLADALVVGARAMGEDAHLRVIGKGPPLERCDLACFVGVKNRESFRRYRAEGINVAYFDKGYIRSRAPVEWLDYWRVAVNEHNPVSYLNVAKHTPERFKALRFDNRPLEVKPWRKPLTKHDPNAILIDGSSAKHYAWHDLGDPTAYTKKIVDALKGLGRPIIYRPKPSWSDWKPIAGTVYSGGKDIRLWLAQSSVFITYGSNASFESVLEGVPCIVLGDAIARPISSTSIADVEAPYYASEEERWQWFANLAWCQFELHEFRDGTAWRQIRKMIECAPRS